MVPKDVYVRCPACGADPRTPCRSRSGQIMARRHRARIAEIRRRTGTV